MQVFFNNIQHVFKHKMIDRESCSIKRESSQPHILKDTALLGWEWSAQ